MSAGAIYTAPVRADLSAVPRMYYPVVEQRRFGSVAAMCKHYGWPRDLVDQAVEIATVEGSVANGQGFVLVGVDALAFGDPEDNIRAALWMQPGGAVVLCAGMFCLISEDRAAVCAMVEKFAADPALKGRFMSVVEFPANHEGAAA